MEPLSFPRQSARTQRFTLGEPRSVTVSPDGKRVVFLRSAAGDDPVNCLWLFDTESGDERLIADPRVLLGDDDGDLPPEERARRERAREGAGGVVAYATDTNVTVCSFALAGRLFVAGLISGAARELPVDGPVFDPRPDPTARRVAYVCGATLRIGELDATSWQLNGEADPDVTWGSADFVAAEEMDRQRGYWWAPDGSAIAVQRTDNSPVQTWHIADPANPATVPTVHRYPAAGTPNAEVSLHVTSLDGGSVAVEWDRDTYPYLAKVSWPVQDRLLVTVQSRDQRLLTVLAADPVSGATTLLFEDADDAWVELVPGVPALTSGGALVMTADRDGARRLLVDGAIVTPPELQVRSVVSVADASITFIANDLATPAEQHVWTATLGDTDQGSDGGATCTPITDEPGVHAAITGGGTIVIRSATLAEPGTSTTVHASEPESKPDSEVVHTLVSHAQIPSVVPRVSLRRVGTADLPVAVLLPTTAQS
ncbi:MAG TPA: DPP IV N-terminal domain-containing protein, partial [Ilumatobacteraceae bacterium]|nr:DPP IV N-terminal domain-containing protein [Ilumatobacteraceae bacterium]